MTTQRTRVLTTIVSAVGAAATALIIVGLASADAGGSAATAVRANWFASIRGRMRSAA